MNVKMEENVEPTTEAARTIRAINVETVHKICSGQVSEYFQ